jgi:hypothetical protein
MEAEGYLYLPGFLDREAVCSVRSQICAVLNREGLLDENFPVEHAIARKGPAMYFRPDIAEKGPAAESLKRLIYGEKIMSFFDDFLGSLAMHYDYTWLRAVSPGMGTQPHCDFVYMGRGTKDLYSCWTPLGDIPLDVGGLILIESSHHDSLLRETYSGLDVDATCANRPNENPLEAAGFSKHGAIGADISRVRDRTGGRLLTAEEFRMGDVLIFSAFTVHGSLDNGSNQIRLSSDSRYQRANEVADERWIGEHPPGHGTLVRGMIC